jgi:alkanesulfonate monooxygenase SsuD/methylene tetrahydromethanopterin reductase-like flavin-dependent oxidoreductase (luciferase family)
MSNAIDFGLLLAFRNPSQWAQPREQLYEDHIEQAVYAEALGYDTVWTTEHHFAEDEWSPSLLPILAAMAARTNTIRLGTFLIVLPFHHPVRVAEDAATVDIISKGRLELGLGLGYWLSEFASFNIPRNERVSRLREGIEIIRKCFTEDSFSYEGRYHTLRQIEMRPKPVQQPHPPIWIGAMMEKSVRRTAELGCHLAGSGGADLQQMYDGALRDLGKDVEAHKISQLRAVYIAESRDQAWDDAQDHLHYMMSSYDKRYKEADDLPWAKETMTAPEVPPAAELRHLKDLSFFQAPLIVGSPDDAISEIERYRAETRVTHLVMWMQLPGLPDVKARRSMELFAKEVMPHFRKG